MHTWFRSLGIFAAVAALALAGCSKNSMSPTSSASGTMRIQMTDAPGNYDAIHLVIREVSAHRADSDSSGGWVVINPESTTYDLLTLRNGVFATIGTALVPAGHYTQIRLLLGPGSDVVVDGVTHPLTVPSGLQTGVKLVGNFDIAPNGLTDVALDFDAQRSVLRTGNGSYKLKPVVRAMTFSSAGSISGTVLPAGVATTVYALQAPDTIGSTMAAADGAFKLCALPAGTYSVAFHPDTAYRDTTIAGVAVSAGGTTSLGSVQLTHQ
jgi:hypothetical protein